MKVPDTARSMEQLLKKIFDYVQERGFNLERVQKAYTLAGIYHKDHKRKSGEPYLIHLISVTAYLTDYNADEDSLIAAFLHDAVEDTDCTLEDIEKEFGPEVAKLINGMTKFSKTAFQKEESLNNKIESLRKWFQVMQDDVRVAIIKLFDRLHNMETLGHHGNIEKEKKIAMETINIHVKIARKLGLYDVKAELEKLCLPYADPENYELFQAVHDNEMDAAERLLPKIEKRLRGQDTEKKIIDIKHKQLSILDMYDLEIQAKEHLEGTTPLIVIITTETVADCYYVLYLLHSIWHAEKGMFYDFINSPVASGYQGLHTTVRLAGGREVIFKIRTNEMDEYRTYGVSLYCFNNKTSENYSLPKWLGQISHVVNNEVNDSQNFWEQLQNDILNESITIYTGQGAKGTATILLPPHSTALDAAFYAHQQRALYTKSVFVNGVEKNLYHHLSPHDSVTFTFDNVPTVTYQWLHYVDTSLSNSYVKQGLKQHDRSQKVSIGQRILQEQLEKSHRGSIEELGEGRLQDLLDHYNLPDTETFYTQIAEGDINPKNILKELYPNKNFLNKPSHKIIKARGSFHSLSKLFDTLPSYLKSGLQWSIKSNHRGCILTCTSKTLSAKQWRHVIQLFESARDVEVTLKSNYWNYIKLFIYVPLINILWGLDPVFGRELLLNYVDPATMTTIRFLVVSAFLFLFIHFTSPKKKTLKKLPLFHPIIFILALLLFGVAFSTYNALGEGTPASYYLLFLHPFSWFTLGTVLVYKKRNPYLNTTATVLVMGVGLSALMLDPGWTPTAKLWTIVTLLSFSFFNFIGNYYRDKEKVVMRHQHFLLLLYLYCITFTIPLGFFFPLWEGITPGILLITALYSIVFTGLPYLLYIKLIAVLRDSIELDTVYLNGAVFIALAAELMLYGYLPGIYKVLGIIGVFTGIALILPFRKRARELT